MSFLNILQEEDRKRRHDGDAHGGKCDDDNAIAAVYILSVQTAQRK